jgi:hypothetical protein
MSTPIVTTYKTGIVEKSYTYGNEFFISVKPDDGGSSTSFKVNNPGSFKIGSKVSYTMTTGPAGNLLSNPSPSA